jgi:hypothetical protein
MLGMASSPRDLTTGIGQAEIGWTTLRERAPRPPSDRHSQNDYASKVERIPPAPGDAACRKAASEATATLDRT